MKKKYDKLRNLHTFMEAKVFENDTAITHLGGLIRPYIPPTQAEQVPSQIQPSPIPYEAENAL